MSSALATHELIYVVVNIIGASRLVSIFGQSPLCHGDCLVEELPTNLIVFSGVFMVAVSPST